MAIDKSRLQALTPRLAGAVNNSAANDLDDPTNRQAVVAAARDILYEATLPEEQWNEQAAAVGSITATRLFLKWGAFDAIPATGGITYADLAKTLNADESLIRRVGGMLVSTRILRQVGDNQLVHTPKSLIQTNSSGYSYLFRMMFDENTFPFIFMPQYFDKYGLCEPKGETHNPYTFANGQPEKSYWDVMHQDPERMRVFQQSMRSAEAMMPATGLYDYSWIQGEADKDSDRPLLVDVGGGRGHVVQAICEEYTWMPKERCVVQDREDVIKEAQQLDVPELRGVKLMPHDFNAKQPTKGALVYHLRRILHDYGDATCIVILRHLAEAMAEDSRLLIVDQVVGNPPSQMAAHFDFVMMTIGGKERTAKDFERLTKEAGLRILTVHEKAGAPLAVVECMKVE
ncbi:hypothetical protein NM208_g9793 [Fusarium decemcellulare]|uniref:Uncharacterized protein n=1 Tax=Fusarium decemcellulare TaxID=57161 RepID=A0ACC1S0E1_9HYPO|nr:hypothetical protein NM208_g9793 [Fusarium decemcellulare]